MTDIRQIFNRKAANQRQRELQEKYLKSQTSSYIQSPEKRSLFNQYSSQGNSKIYQQNPILQVRKSLVDDSKRIIRRQFMKDELQKFSTKMIKEVVWKILVVLAFLFGLTVGGLFSWRICIQCVLFSFAYLINASNLIESSPTLKKWINFIQYLSFAAIFYDMLKENGFSHPQHHRIIIDLPIFIITFIATINFYVLQKYSFLFQPKICIPVNIIEGSTQFLRGFFTKLYSIYRVRRVLIMINLSFALGFIIYCIYNQNDRIFESTAQINLLVFSFILFLMMQMFVTFLTQLSKINRLSLDFEVHKVALYISLLRMNPTQQNKIIQHICLKQLAKKIQKDMNILETQVKINLIYNNYNDIFQQYYNSVLTSQIKNITQAIFKIQNNSRFVSQSKSIKKDMFIWPKKGFATLQNQYFSLQLLQSINDISLLFFIISKIEASSNSIKQSTIDSISQLRSLYYRLSKEKIISELLKVKFQEWCNELQHLIMLIDGKNRSNGLPQKENKDGWITNSIRNGQKHW